jgi:putative flippase GtrA
MTSPALRFLLAGGLAAAINWLARIALSSVLPFSVAILVAYAIGMVAGFVLYRRFVFAGGQGSLSRQIPVFLAVNAIGALVVLATTTGLDAVIGHIVPGFPPIAREAFAHGAAIAIGAVANYLGHKRLTFAAPVPMPAEGSRAYSR